MSRNNTSFTQKVVVLHCYIGVSSLIVQKTRGKAFAGVYLRTGITSCWSYSFQLW